MRSPLGVGASRFHTGGEAGAADTVYLGVFRRSALERVGGYDERFTRAQDWELNHRIRATGGTVWFTPELAGDLPAPPHLAALARQYFQYGRWRRVVARQHHAGTINARYLAPPAMVVGTTLAIGSSASSWRPALAGAGGYVAAVAVGGVAISAGRAARHPAARPGRPWRRCTGAWGIGFLAGSCARTSTRRATRVARLGRAPRRSATAGGHQGGGGMRRTLMLVWTGVSTDTRVLREATALVAGGPRVHIIGRSVPRRLRAAARGDRRTSLWSVPAECRRPAVAQLRPRRTARAVGAAAAHCGVACRRGRARPSSRPGGGRRAADVPDAVHAHDFTALAGGSALADEWDVPLVYDTHEYWVGRPGRGPPGAPPPTPRGAGRRRARWPAPPRSSPSGRAWPTRCAGTTRAGPRSRSCATPSRAPEVPAAPASPPTGLRVCRPARRRPRARGDRRGQRASSTLPITLRRARPTTTWLAAFDAARLRRCARPCRWRGRRRAARRGRRPRDAQRQLGQPPAGPAQQGLPRREPSGVPVVATDVGELGRPGAASTASGTLYRPGDAAGARSRAVEAVARGPRRSACARVAAARAALSWDVDAAALASSTAQRGLGLD